jgi:hypothetical protein
MRTLVFRVFLVCVGAVIGHLFTAPQQNRPRATTHWRDVSSVVILDQPSDQPGPLVTHSGVVHTWRLGSECVTKPDDPAKGHLTVLLRFSDESQLMLVSQK